MLLSILPEGAKWLPGAGWVALKLKHGGGAFLSSYVLA